APALPLIGLLFEPSLRSRLRLASESFSLKAVQLPAADAQFQRQPGDVLTSLHPFQRRLTEIIVILPGTAHILSLLILLRFDNTWIRRESAFSGLKRLQPGGSGEDGFR